ncbi:MAG: universal stress protein [Planctomycetota bacterium]|nr:MAG: universal stress protein [Planctomycetota bacterium]
MQGEAEHHGRNEREHDGPVLVPVDFSPYSADALTWAARLCERIGAPLAVLHVVHDPESAPGYYGQAQGEEHLQRIEEAAASMMDAFLANVAAEHPDIGLLKTLAPTLVPGLPVTRILEVADKLGASMIAMGSQGRTGLPHLMIGSKAQRVAQLSPIPVTIVKCPGREASHAER